MSSPDLLGVRHTPDLRWTYTFCDLRTNDELATFDLTGVKFGRALGGAGKFSGYLSLLDPDLRLRNPWAVTRGRRTALYVEMEDVADPMVPGPSCVWGGIVWGRGRSSASNGLTLTGATFESWLARQRLRSDMIGVNAGQDQVMGMLLDRVAGPTFYPNADVGVRMANSAPMGLELREREYLLREGNTLLTLFENFGKTNTGGEFRIDCYRGSDGRFRRDVVVGEPKLGRPWEDTEFTLNYPDGDLESWTLDEDGTDVDTALIVTGSGTGDDQPVVIVREQDLMLGQVATGFPELVGRLQLSNQSNPAILLEEGYAELRRKFAAEMMLGGLRVKAAAKPMLGTYQPGDAMRVEITHVSMESWPKQTQFLARLLGFECTPGDGQVSMVVGGAA